MPRRRKQQGKGRKREGQKKEKEDQPVHKFSFEEESFTQKRNYRTIHRTKKDVARKLGFFYTEIRKKISP